VKSGCGSRFALQYFTHVETRPEPGSPAPGRGDHRFEAGTRRGAVEIAETGNACLRLRNEGKTAKRAPLVAVKKIGLTLAFG